MFYTYSVAVKGDSQQMFRSLGGINHCSIGNITFFTQYHFRQSTDCRYSQVGVAVFIKTGINYVHDQRSNVLLGVARKNSYDCTWQKN